MSTGVLSFSRSTCSSVRMRVTNGLSEMSPSKVITSRRPREVHEPHRPAQVVVVGDRDHLAHERDLVAVPLEQLAHVDRLEDAGLEVDDVRLLRRVAQGLLGRLVDAQARLAGRDQHRVVVGEAVDRARAEAGHDPQQAVLARGSGRTSGTRCSRSPRPEKAGIQ